MASPGTAQGSTLNGPGRRARNLCAFAAALAYLLVALFLLRGVLPDPSRLLPFNGQIDERSAGLGHMDQSMVVAVIARNADALLRSPLALRTAAGACHPLPRSWVLGEPMFGEGLLMALPWALTGDPILAYNGLLLLTLWIPGLTAYALGMRFLGSPPAAFVTGLLFQLVPARIVDGGHPYLHGDLWLPLALLALHDVFRRARWRDALLLALMTALCALETIYVLLASLLQLGVYALHLWRGAPRRGRSLALLGLAGVVSGAVAAWMLLPYFDARTEWGLLEGRQTFFAPWWIYLPGFITFPGFAFLGLLALGLADRLYRKREVEGDDPRLALLGGTLLVLWCSVAAIPIPGLGVGLPSPFLLLASVVPGFDAVRSMYAIGNAAWLGACVVAGYGVLRLGALAAGRVVLAGCAAGLLVLVLHFEPRLARLAFGAPLDFGIWEGAPSRAEIDLIKEVAGESGAILELPMPEPGQAMARLRMARQMLLAAYARRPTAACYNSFESPLADQIWQLTKSLPAPGAVAALDALGFGTVLSHASLWRPGEGEAFEVAVAAQLGAYPRLVESGRRDGLKAYRVEVGPPQASGDLPGSRGEGSAGRPWPMTGDVSVLVPAREGETGTTPDKERQQLRWQADHVTEEGAKVGLQPKRQRLRLPVQVARETVFRVAEFTPSELLVRWRDQAGRIVAEHPTRGLLPLALAPGLTMAISLEVRPPGPGLFVVEVEPLANRGRVIARVGVEVLANEKPQ